VTTVAQDVLDRARERLGNWNPVLVHDYLLVMRGAERTFVKMCDLFPDAPISTLLYDGALFDERLAGHEVRTSPLQRIAAAQHGFHRYLPAMPYMAGRLPVSGHDLVLTSSSAFAHGVRPDPDALHVCLCHTPFRYAWGRRAAGLGMLPPPLRPPANFVLERIKNWDYEVAQRGTVYLAVGRLTQKHIREWWGIEAPVVRHSIELHRFAPAPERDDYALVVGELVRHKHVDVALEAARRAGVPIKVVGDGLDGRALRAAYGDTAEFVGRVSDPELAELYARARVLIMTAIEEFGLTSVEAQASGCPVLAFGAGGALETVVDGETGVLVPPGDVEGMARVLRSDVLDGMSVDAMVRNANRFTLEAFYSDLIDHILGAAERR
jgi:glycosyltransferase involved in cell wall biosynthesis